MRHHMNPTIHRDPSRPTVLHWAPPNSGELHQNPLRFFTICLAQLCFLELNRAPPNSSKLCKPPNSPAELRSDVLCSVDLLRVLLSSIEICWTPSSSIELLGAPLTSVEFYNFRQAHPSYAELRLAPPNFAMSHGGLPNSAKLRRFYSISIMLFWGPTKI